MELIKKEGCASGPKGVVAFVSEKAGGVIGASAPGQLPRGEAQVSNVIFDSGITPAVQMNSMF